MIQKTGAVALFSLLLLLFIAQPGFPMQDAAQNRAEDALKLLADDTLSYFNSVTGEITSVKGNSVRIEPGPKETLKKGMRLTVYKEGAPFVHPVTKEPLGKIELPIGTIEVTSVAGQDAAGIIINGDPKAFTNAKVKIPATQIKMLFYQGAMDWFLGDAYYRMLKATNRFELIDTGIETTDIQKILAEAKARGADAAVILLSETSAGQVALEQKLFWIGDSKEFAEKKVSTDADSVKELRLKAGLFIPSTGEQLLSFSLPYKADHLAAGDLAGDGKMEIALASGNKIRIYRPGVDLKSMEEFSVPAGDILWIDTLDINKDGKDEILVTAMHGDEVISYIYTFQNSSFIQLLETKNLFLRKLGNQAIAQEFSKRDGYDGPVYYFTLANNNTFQKGNILKLPAGVNIYDFQRFTSPEGKQSIVAWDENGFLQVFNDQGLRLWISKEDFGGFSTTFSKESGFIIDRGQWSIKDRLLVSNNEVLAPKRKPLLGISKSLGYSSSSIKGLWWNGSAVEERDFIENAGGDLLDYDILGDRLAVLTKDAFTTKALNIFKGESIFGVKLYIFSLKGI